jgi:hypothetical protein
VAFFPQVFIPVGPANRGAPVTELFPIWLQKSLGPWTMFGGGGYTNNGTVNLSGRISRMQATSSGHWGLLPTHTADFGPDLEFLGPGSSMLGGSDVIAAEVEEVIDLVVG